MSTGKVFFSQGLSQKGLLLVVVLLSFEFVFVGGLWFLLGKAEEEARKQELLRDISVNTNRLIELNYVAIYSLKDLVSTQDLFYAKKYKRTVEEIQSSLDWLDKNLEERAYQREIISKLRKKFAIIFSIVDGAVKIYEGDGGLLELRRLVKKRGNFETLNREMIPDFQELLRAQRHMEMRSPILEQRWRDQAKTLLLCGLTLNVVAAVAMALFYTRSIVSRLGVLVENTRRLKAGEELLPGMRGDDEIALLDSVFHEMARELTEAAHKERRALEEAQEAEARIRQVIISMPVGLFISDRDGTILFANPRASDLIGLSRDLLKGYSLRELLPVFRERLEERGGLAEVCEELQEKSRETVVMTSSGRETDIELSITPFDSASQKRFLITLLDITERIEIQKLRQSFVAMVSHELRTPLNSVQGFLELLEMGALGEISADACDGVVRASHNIERLMGLINDLLDLEKMESGTISISCNETVVADLFDHAAQSVAELAKKNKLTIRCAEDESTVFCDSDRISQVLINLVGNAIKFSPEGGLIELKSESEGDFVEISVVDQGPGIPKEYRETVFERYRQVPDESGKRVGGTGLGLAICKAILERHGSRIQVEDAFDDGRTGSRFYFRLSSNAISTTSTASGSSEDVAADSSLDSAD